MNWCFYDSCSFFPFWSFWSLRLKYLTSGPQRVGDTTNGLKRRPNSSKGRGPLCRIPHGCGWHSNGFCAAEPCCTAWEWGLPEIFSLSTMFFLEKRSDPKGCSSLNSYHLDVMGKPSSTAKQQRAINSTLRVLGVDMPLISLEHPGTFVEVLFFLNTSFPHEPSCGPFDSHQTPGTKQTFVFSSSNMFSVLSKVEHWNTTPSVQPWNYDDVL